MTDSPTVSVVIPTYNRADVLPRAIESVFEQTFQDFEIVVVDDGSTDDTETVVASYDDERLTYIRQPNQGANAARNRGIERARGSYVSFLDSDDELLPSHLARIVDTVSESDPEVGGVCTSYRIVDSVRGTRLKSVPHGRITLADLASDNVIGGFTGVTFRRDVIESIGELDEELEAYQDVDYFVRVLKQFDIIGIDEVLARYHVHRNRISSPQHLESRIRAQDRIIQKHGDILGEPYVADLQYNRGLLHADRGEMKVARTSFRAAISLDPMDPRYYYHLVGAVLGRTGHECAKLGKRILRRYGEIWRGRRGP